MIKALIGLTTAATVSAVLLSSSVSGSEQVDLTALRHEVGISDTVWGCANRAVAGLDEQQLIVLIQASESIGTDQQSDTQRELVACVMKDPFGLEIDGLTPDERIALNIINGGK